MKILDKTKLPLKFDTASAIGYFDGLHIGHEALINELLSHKDCKKIVYTFDYKPDNTKDIFTLDEKKILLMDLHIDFFYFQEFTKEFANLSPKDFLIYLKTSFGVKHITVGFDFNFGKDAKGNVETLEKFAKELDYTYSVISKICLDGIKVSSTQIKNYLAQGDIKNANNMLGKYYFIQGTVNAGKQIGRTIDFPTINISTSKLTPKCGVYATKTLIEGKKYSSITNVGKNPTVGADDKTKIETYVFDFNKNIYGSAVQVYFIEFIRGEKKFDSLEELKKQIALDSIYAKSILSKTHYTSPF